MKCFYILPSDIFATNISNRMISSINNKLIKGKVVSYACSKSTNSSLLNFQLSVSHSQGLEIFKYQNFGLKAEGFLIFNPFI
jgi:hypothetical protein